MEQSCQRTVENVSCDAGYQGYQHPIAAGFTIFDPVSVLVIHLAHLRKVDDEPWKFSSAAEPISRGVTAGYVA